MTERPAEEEVKRIACLACLEYPKTIMDPIHGCIQLTELEYNLLQLPPLNRLHHIHQLGLAYLVYPAAKTSRFEHSLGVLSLASKMIYQILGSSTLKELKEIFGLEANSENFAGNCYVLIQKVRLAALLHDIGHGPFSHVTEPILREVLNEKEIKEAKALFKCKKEKDIPIHEYFSYKMITDENSIVKRAIESYYQHKPYKITAKDVADLLIKEETGESNRILRKIISSQLDADRMDCLLRDSHATGLPFGLIDIDRIISNTFVAEYEGSYQLIVHERALRAVEDMLDARIKMYKSLYSHHLICALEELLKEAVKSMLHKEDLHYQKFLEGEVDDVFVLSKLREYQKNPVFKAFFDRRYIPVGLIKRDLDLKEFLGRIRGQMKVGLADEEISRKFKAWLKAIEKKEFKERRVADNYLLISSKPFSPYKVLSEEDRILIGRKGSRPRDLLEASDYIKKLNEEAKEGKFFRVSFISPDLDKEKLKRQRDNVYEQLMEQIIEFKV